MSDYKAAFNAAAADLSAIIALLGFTKYPGVDPVLRAITDLILDKAENQVLREERDSSQARVAELERTQNAICDLFMIGANVRDHATIMANIQNIYRHCNMLHAIEAEFFMVPGEPSDEPEDEGLEPDEVCLLNCWGLTVEQYVEQFREALAVVAQAGQVPEVQARKLGIYGRAYDLPETKRAYTYAEQPDNLGASRLGRVLSEAVQVTFGDHIDGGLALLRALEVAGFGVFELADAPQPAPGGDA